MQLSKVKEGDVVEVNIRGRVFDATVKEKIPYGVRIEPVKPNMGNYFQATSTQVKKIVQRSTQ